MGRGRAKAKQQKVARELKYNTHHTDLTALQRELAGSAPAGTVDTDKLESDELADEFDDDDWASGSR
ncbi:MAG: DUF3073 domain-containing protein [Marmoricola sp.]